MAKNATTGVRTFSVPAGTVVNGTTITEAIVRRIEYSKSELTPSQAQKQAIREVVAEIRDRYGISVTQKALQGSTATVNRPAGRARGGRIPDAAKVLGFKVLKDQTPKGKAAKGLTTYTRGTEKSRPIANGYDAIDRMVRDAFARNPHATIKVAAYGFPAENPRELQSPRRRRKDHPLGIWKRGDIIPKSQQWGGTAPVRSLDEWERRYGTPEKWQYGPSGKPDDRGKHTGTEIDPERVKRIDIIVSDK